MKIKTKDLIGKALDFAVAKCEGLPLRLDPMGFRKDAPKSSQAGWWVWDEKPGVLKMLTQLVGKDYSPSTDWAQGGPIIEREKFDTAYLSRQAEWYAYHRARSIDDFVVNAGFGSTPLIAAMRCYVSATYGDETDIPEELCDA